MALAYLSLMAPEAGAARRFDDAERGVRQTPGTTITAASQPVRVSGADPRQPVQSCKVVAIVTGLKARALLDACISLEAAMGRDHTDIWGVRPIDIDLLAYDDIEIRSSRLHLPHPFAHRRNYVIEPLRQIAPEVAAWVERVGNRPR